MGQNHCGAVIVIAFRSCATHGALVLLVPEREITSEKRFKAEIRTNCDGERLSLNGLGWRVPLNLRQKSSSSDGMLHELPIRPYAIVTAGLLLALCQNDFHDGYKRRDWEDTNISPVTKTHAGSP